MEEEFEAPDPADFAPDPEPPAVYADGGAYADGVIDDARAADRIDFGVAQAGMASRRGAMAMADQLAAIKSTIADATDNPQVFLTTPNAANARDMAVRCIRADLAIELGLSESTVQGMAADADLLIDHLPSVWTLLVHGDISYQKARLIGETARSLPLEVLAEFDTQIAPFAGKLVPMKLRARAKLIAERLNPQALEDRFQDATAFRRLRVTPAEDGMAELWVLAPAADIYRADARIDANARALAAVNGETRTLEQLRVDELMALLTGDGSAHPVTVTTGLLVPVQTALDRTDPTPSMLDGYGPIPPSEARRLAAKSPTFYRILTDPITGIRMTMDRTTYRPTAQQRRWLAWRDGVCDFPGCNRRNCDVDHTIQWQEGGPTNIDNLALLSPGHHTLKDTTRWQMTRDKPTKENLDGQVRFTSPLGRVHIADPPPF